MKNNSLLAWGLIILVLAALAIVLIGGSWDGMMGTPGWGMMGSWMGMGYFIRGLVAFLVLVVVPIGFVFYFLAILVRWMVRNLGKKEDLATQICPNCSVTVLAGLSACPHCQTPLK